MSTTRSLPPAVAEILRSATESKLRASFCIASSAERKGRLRAVIGLSVELERIRTETDFGTGLAEQVIEDIIEGDWRAAHELGTCFRFTEESAHLRDEQAPRWRKFVEIVSTECALAEKRARGEGGRRPD